MSGEISTQHLLISLETKPPGQGPMAKKTRPLGRHLSAVNINRQKHHQWAYMDFLNCKWSTAPINCNPICSARWSETSGTIHMYIHILEWQTVRYHTYLHNFTYIHYITLCCVALRCVALRYFTLRYMHAYTHTNNAYGCKPLHTVAHHHISLHMFANHYILLYYFTFQYIHQTTLRWITWPYIALHCMTLHCTTPTLHDITLHRLYMEMNFQVGQKPVPVVCLSKDLCADKTSLDIFSSLDISFSWFFLLALRLSSTDVAIPLRKATGWQDTMAPGQRHTPKAKTPQVDARQPLDCRRR